VASTHGDLSSKIPELIGNKVNKFIDGVLLYSFRVSFYYNYEKFNKVFEKIDPVQAVDKISEAKREADEEVEIGKIQLDKTRRLNNIELERSKENNEKEIKLRELEIQKYSRINSKKRETELKDAELENDNNLKTKDLENKLNLKSIQDYKSVELEKINSELEIKSRKKDLEIADINNKLEVDKHKYQVESQIHEEEVSRKNRELRLTVELPAEAEAKRLKLLAENKAEIKKIDTKSSIESSRAKAEYKKEESSILAEIKDKRDEADLSLYSKMIKIAASNPELAIQWKKIESEVESVRIKSESISKLPLENIIINGSGSEILDMLSLTSNSNKDESKTSKDSRKK
jgi:flotillin